MRARAEVRRANPASHGVLSNPTSTTAAPIRQPTSSWCARLSLSAAIEATQFLSDVMVSGGWTANVNDLPANTIGAVLGYLTYRSLTSLPVVAVVAVAGRWEVGTGPDRPNQVARAASSVR